MSGYAVVIGAVNMDIWGQAEAPVIPRDSNPGLIRCAPGGVGRNIARNLALMGAQVHMLTALGGDAWAPILEADCLQGGVSLPHLIRAAELGSSSYLYITGPGGEMELAVCDAQVVERITPARIASALALLNGAALVVLECNLSEETIRYAVENITAPLFVDPVSVTKSRKLRGLLPRLFCIKPNAAEAEALTGLTSPGDAALALAAMGVNRAFVSDGSRGIYAAEGQALLHVPCCTARMVNCNGGGDAVTAALCRSFLEGLPLPDAARYAMTAGAIAVESRETISPEMRHEKILARMENAYE